MDPILVVDDEKDNLDAIQRLLRTTYDTTTTTSVIDALKLIRERRFNVVISDQRMPDMTGVEFLEKLKTVCPSTTRVLLTGYTDIASIIDAINRGNIYRYIAKPWDPDEFKITIRQANEAYLLRHELEEKNEKLTQAFNELKTLDDSKNRFMSLISHELNTPLTIFQSYLSILSEHKMGLSADVKKAVTALEGVAQRFSDIITEVLAYLRLTTTTSKVNLQPFNLAEELRTIFDQVEKHFSSKKLVLEVRSTENARILCDRDAMRLALAKLLYESCDKATTQSTIEIAIESVEQQIVTTIKRTGESWTEESFKPLEPHGDELRHGHNMRLALAMFRLVIEAHGGSLNLPKVKTNHSALVFRLHRLSS